MCGWGPYAREASVWEACCRYSGVINMFLNCLSKQGVGCGEGFRLFMIYEVELGCRRRRQQLEAEAAEAAADRSKAFAWYSCIAESFFFFRVQGSGLKSAGEATPEERQHLNAAKRSRGVQKGPKRSKKAHRQNSGCAFWGDRDSQKGGGCATKHVEEGGGRAPHDVQMDEVSQHHLQQRRPAQLGVS